MTANGQPIINAIVTLFYPAANGTVTSTSLNNGPNGTYTFSGVNIPYGTLSLMVTGRGTYGPTPINLYNGHNTFNVDMTHVGGAGKYLILDPNQTQGFGASNNIYTLNILNTAPTGTAPIVLYSFTAQWPTNWTGCVPLLNTVFLERIRNGGTTVYGGGGNYQNNGAQTNFNAGQSISIAPGATVSVAVRFRYGLLSGTTNTSCHPSGNYTTTFYDQAAPGGIPYDFTFTAP